MMISVIKTVHKTFNVIGTDDGLFILQGNLTEDQLRELIAEAKKALEET
jgi:hypothetical protein